MSPEVSASIETLTKASRRKAEFWEQPYKAASGVVVEPRDLRAILARVAELEAGLEPFAQAAQNAEISGHPPFQFVGADCYVRARALLGKEGPE